MLSSESPLRKRSATPGSLELAPRPITGSARPRRAQDHALTRAEHAEQAAQLAQQDAARAQVGEQASREDAALIHADADKTLAAFPADAARARAELRSDLRAMAERAERQADGYSDELAQLRAGTSRTAGITTAHRTLPPADQAAQS
jgi:hypothetical protein